MEFIFSDYILLVKAGIKTWNQNIEPNGTRSDQHNETIKIQKVES